MNSPDGIAITERFFEALNMVIEQKRIRGVQTFTRMHGINTWKLKTVRKNKEVAFLGSEYLSCIVSDFGVSPIWLLTGLAGMFETRK